jgi:HK97 family phage major capsid protein
MKEKIKQLNTELQKLSADAKELYADMTKKSDDGKKAYDGQSDDRAKLIALEARGQEIVTELKALNGLTQIDQIANEPAEGQKTVPTAGGQPQVKSIGQQVIDSPQFKAAGQTKNLDVVEIKGLNEGTNTAGGYLVQPDRRPGLRAAPERPITLLDLIPFIATDSNLVEYVKQGLYTNNADFVAEGALKPESNMAFGIESAKVLTIAHWIEITRQLLQDAPRIRSYVDGRLLIGLRRRLEEKIVTSTDADFLGLLNRVGIQTRAHGTASNGLGGGTDNKFDTIRYAIADLSLKFYQADLIVLSSIEAAEFETVKDANGNYMNKYDPVAQRLWRLRVVEVPLMPAGTALVMDSDFSAEVYDRGVLAVYTGQPDDFFLRNKFAILAEGRYGLGVPFPEGISKVTGL